jgi:hypothetical protein
VAASVVYARPTRAESMSSIVGGVVIRGVVVIGAAEERSSR